MREPTFPRPRQAFRASLPPQVAGADHRVLYSTRGFKRSGAWFEEAA